MNKSSAPATNRTVKPADATTQVPATTPIRDPMPARPNTAAPSQDGMNPPMTAAKGNDEVMSQPQTKPRQLPADKE